MKPKRILLTGASGQVGYELARSLSVLGEVDVPTRQELDLSNPSSIGPYVQTVRPDLIVNPAAYTAVDQAETDPAAAQTVNALAPGILAEEGRRVGAVMIHFSTDYVYDGTKPGAYVETDATNPLSEYGRSKLQGENSIRQSGIPHLILRTSWVYSLRGKNFLLTMIRLMREREELRVVADQVGAPTWSRSIAEATACIVAQGGLAWKDFLSERAGIYHVSTAGAVSWHGFAQAIEAELGREDTLKVKHIHPISTEEYPLPAVRPKNSQLDTSKLLAAFQVRLPMWRDALKLCLN